MKTYTDDQFCDHCNKETKHEITDAGHERDSSNDMFKCLECHWGGMGLTGKYSPPFDYEDDEDDEDEDDNIKNKTMEVKDYKQTVRTSDVVHIYDKEKDVNWFICFEKTDGIWQQDSREIRANQQAQERGQHNGENGNRNSQIKIW